MPTLFLSHATADDAVVDRLRTALAELGEQVWIDSRQLRGGQLLWPAVAQAIDQAAAFAVLVSPDALQSDWVTDELDHALKRQQAVGADAFPVIPLTLDGTRLGAFKRQFAAEPAWVPVASTPGGIDAALHAILVALGRRLPTASLPAPLLQPQAEPIEELILELTDLRWVEQDAKRRPSARARLLYQPADPAQREVRSLHAWRLIPKLGPIEADDLRWYLEDYAVWPSRYDVERARRIEASLADWGRDLYQAALPAAHTGNCQQAWARVAVQANRRFSVYVDTATEADAAADQDQQPTPDQAPTAAREAAVALLGLPWELLHDGTGFLFQGARPTRVRRRLPNTGVFEVPVVAPPIRILLVTARPEDDACSFIDHRVGARALVAAVEDLGGLVALDLLRPPTLPALSAALRRARAAGTPYQVVHFDGHGVYDRRVGLGGLCFEDPQDTDRPNRRRHLTVHTDRLGPLLRDHRIPLVFLEACQSAEAHEANESVASELLKVGVAAVVAMSHAVLVETARRFVAALQAVCAGDRDPRLADDPALHYTMAAEILLLQEALR